MQKWNNYQFTPLSKPQLFFELLPIYRKISKLGKKKHRPKPPKEFAFVNKLNTTNNQDDLFNMLIETDKTEKENWILKKLTEESVLMKIVYSNKRDELRFSAASKLRNEDSFIEIVNSQAPVKMKLQACDKIVDKTLLKGLIQKGTHPKILLKIIEKTGGASSVTEKTFLKLINQTKDKKLKLSVYQKITDEEKLKEIILAEEDI